MDIKFPQQENPFPKTLRNAIFACILALAVGLFLGNALGAFFGTDESIVNTSNYTDRMSAARSVFTDADQFDSYLGTALTFQDMEGLKLYANRDRDGLLALWNGELLNAYDLFDEDIRKSLHELMNTQEALYGLETAAGTPIEDLYLRNVAVEGGVVYYYLYYDEAGFIGLAYDETGETLTSQGDIALPLTKTADSEDGCYQWFITYHIEE